MEDKDVKAKESEDGKQDDEGGSIDPFQSDDAKDDSEGKEVKGKAGNYGEWNRAHTKMQDMLSDDVLAVMQGKEKNILDGLDDGGEDSEAESEDEEE